MRLGFTVMAAEPMEVVMLVSVNIKCHSLKHTHLTYNPQENKRTKNNSHMHNLSAFTYEKSPRLFNRNTNIGRIYIQLTIRHKNMLQQAKGTHQPI